MLKSFIEKKTMYNIIEKEVGKILLHSRDINVFIKLDFRVKAFFVV